MLKSKSHPEWSSLVEPDNWDIARLPRSEGRAGQAAWAESFAARAFGLALTAQPEFWTHLDKIRAGVDAREVARAYVRRDQGGRLAAVESFLLRGAEADPHLDGRFVKVAVWSYPTVAYFVMGQPDSDAPQRALRSDAAETIAYGAYRVVRRGARRCGNPLCGIEVHGVALTPDNRSGYCAGCTRAYPRPRFEAEGERALFDALVPAVLGAASRPRSRRARRSVVGPPPPK